MRVLIIAVLLLGSVVAKAETLTPEMKVSRAQTELELSKAAKALKKDCAFIPKVKVEWKNFPNKIEEGAVGTFCESVLEAMQTHCKEGAQKKAYIKKNVKRLICDSKKKNAATLKRKGNEVRVYVDFEMSNLDAKMKTALLRGL